MIIEWEKILPKFFYRVDLLDELDNPDFQNTNKVHDWRNHVPTLLQEVWPALSKESRIVAAICAEHEADSEEWN